MKKILIAILLLVPLIIILTLNVSSTIVSANVEIGVERLVLYHQGEVVTFVEIALEDYVTNNKKYLLNVGYTPSYVTDKSVTWLSSDENIATVKKSGNGAAVTFKEGQYGAVDIIVQSESNDSITASCRFYVTGNYVGRLSVCDFDSGDEINAVSMSVGESKSLNVKAYPSEALKEQHITWESKDENIVKVNPNGVLTATGEGECYVTASIDSYDGRISYNLSVQVKGSVLYPSRVYYTSTGSVETSVFSDGGAKLSPLSGVVIEENTIRLEGNEGSILLETANQKQEVKIRRVLSNALVIEHYDDYLEGIWKGANVVAVNSAKVYISASPAFGGSANVLWTSSDESIAVVRDGYIVGKSDGSVILTASAEGYESVSVEILVTHTIGDVELEFDDRGDNAGLGERKVFGIYTCDKDLNVTNTIDLRLRSVYPASIADIPNCFDFFTFSVDNEEYASVDKKGVVTFKREGIGHKVTVTIKANFSDNDASDSYTFDLVDGINIGVHDTNYYDKTVDEELPSFDQFYEYKYLMEEYLGDHTENGTLGAVVFHCNVYVPPKSIYDGLVPINRPMYGNGFVIDGQLHSTSYDSRMFKNGLQHDRIRELCGDDYTLLIENLYIQSYSPISDDSEEAFSELKKSGGTPWRYTGSDEDVGNIKVEFRFCMFRYSYMHLNPAGGNLSFDGCIFTNSAGPAISTQTTTKATCRITIKNCIFSNTISPVFLSTIGNYDGYDEDGNHPAYKHLILNIEGKNYIYNWKNLEEIRMDIFPSDNEYIAILNDLVSQLIKECLSDPDNNQFVHTGHVQGKTINLGFVIAGIWYDNNLHVNPTQEELDNGFVPGVDGTTVYMDDKYFFCGDIDLSFILQDKYKLYTPILNHFYLDPVEKSTYFILPTEKITTPNEKYYLDQKTRDRLHGRE